MPRTIALARAITDRFNATGNFEVPEPKMALLKSSITITNAETSPSPTKIA
jgi:hypothetical protein